MSLHQQRQIDALKARLDELEKTVEDIKPKRRGRPPKRTEPDG